MVSLNGKNFSVLFFTFQLPCPPEVMGMEFTQHPIEKFCCQNPKCSDVGICRKGNLKFSGWSGRGKKIRMIHCKTCGTQFSERKGTVLWESRLPSEKAMSLLDHIKEGVGTRATSRLLHVSKDTVTRYIRAAGSHAEKIHDELVSFSPSDERSSTG